MSITVQEITDKVALDLQENSSFSTGLWTLSEIYGYINYALRQFLNDTSVVIIDESTTSVIGQKEYEKPATAGDIDRIGYNGKRVRRVSLFDLMSIDPSWRSQSGVPKFYHEDGTSSVTSYELDRSPTKAGTLRVFADLLHYEVTQPSDTLDIPDCWEPYIRWEVLSYALQKDGEAQDLARADWAHKKYIFGVSLAQKMVAGMSDVPV
jgi:hypothetical protein